MNNYLTIDGMQSGTGIRNSLDGGYIKPHALGIAGDLISRIEGWVKRYEQAHYTQFDDSFENERLDQEGIAICKLLREELPNSKIDYFSSAAMRKLDI